LSLTLTKADKRSSIIKKAANVFVEKGIHNTTMADVAKSCEVDRRTLYRYFDNKSVLVLESVIYALRVGNVLQDDLAKAQTGNGLERFMGFHYALISAPDKYDFVKLVTDFDRNQELHFTDIDEELLKEYVIEATHSFNLKEQILSEGVKDGSIKQINTTLVAKTIHNIIWAVLQKQHFANEYLHEQLEVDFKEVICNQLEMYEDYLKGENYEVKK